MAIKINIDRHRGLKIRKAPGVARAHSKSGGYSKDIDNFLDLVNTAWTEYQRRIAVPTANYIPVKYINPKEHIESPDVQSNVILFKVISRKRFNETSDGIRRPRAAQFREEFIDPDDSENMITLSALKRENIVEFQIWGTHSKKANQVALQFEGFMQAFDFYFTEQGINRVWFEERMEDRVEETGATEWSIRSLRYLVITELIYKEVDKKLNLITVRHDEGSKLKTVEINTDTDLKEHSIDRS